MTNFERIKQMSLEEMVMFISDISPTTEPFSDIFCRSLCKERVNGHCRFADEEDDTKLPCYAMTHADDVQAWLEAEKENK